VPGLKALNENIRRAQNVAAAERLRLRAVAGDDRIKDRNVFLQDRLRHLHIVAQNFSHDATQIRPMRRSSLTDQGIAGQFVEKCVESHVGVDLIVQGAARYGGAAQFKESGPFGSGSFGASLGRKPGRKPIKHCPYLVEISDEIHVERGDDQAAAGGFPNQAAVTQKQKGLLNRLPGDTVGAGEFVLDQPGIGWQFAIGNFRNDSIYNLFHQGWLGLDLRHWISERFFFEFEHSDAKKAIALYSNSVYEF
jgi:hypothetical protein